MRVYSRFLCVFLSKVYMVFILHHFYTDPNWPHNSKYEVQIKADVGQSMQGYD